MSFWTVRAKPLHCWSCFSNPYLLKCGSFSGSTALWVYVWLKEYFGICRQNFKWAMIEHFPTPTAEVVGSTPWPYSPENSSNPCLHASQVDKILSTTLHIVIIFKYICTCPAKAKALLGTVLGPRSSYHASWGWRVRLLYYFQGHIQQIKIKVIRDTK